MSGAIAFRSCLEVVYGVPLVQAGEDWRTVIRDVDEAVEKVHPSVSGPQLLPEVFGSVSCCAVWIAGAADLPSASRTLVEGQKSRVATFQLRGHEDTVRIDCEMNDGAFA